jgi:hypothetical protein
MQRTVLVLSVTMLLHPATIAAQSGRPDFSGTWIMDAERSESLVNGYESVPVTLVANQTPSLLIVESKRGATSETILYKLDGSETSLPGQVTTTMSWRGASLAMRTVRYISGWAVTVEDTWQLGDNGNAITIERRLNVQHGYEGRAGDGGYSSPARDVFVRSTKP